MLTQREVHLAAGATGVQENMEDQRRERELFARLNEPLKAIPDPLRRVRVLEQFRLGAPTSVPARIAEPGEEISLPTTVARDMAALERVELI